MRIAAMRKTATNLGIEKIDAADRGGYLIFAAESHIDPVALVQLVQNDSRHYRLQGSHRLQITDDLSDLEKRFKTIEDLMQRLTIQDSKQDERLHG